MYKSNDSAYGIYALTGRLIAQLDVEEVAGKMNLLCDKAIAQLYVEKVAGDRSIQCIRNNETVDHTHVCRGGRW